MFQWVYDVTTNQFLYGGPCEVAPNAGQAVVSLLRNPQPRTERSDGAGGIRPATAQEMTDAAAAEKVTRTATDFDEQKLVKALGLWTAQKLGVAPATAKAEILAIYRTL